MKNPQTAKLDDPKAEQLRQRMVDCVLELQAQVEALKKRVAVLEAGP
jgi:hypothetical protein